MSIKQVIFCLEGKKAATLINTIRGGPAYPVDSGGCSECPAERKCSDTPGSGIVGFHES